MNARTTPVAIMMAHLLVRYSLSTLRCHQRHVAKANEKVIDRERTASFINCITIVEQALVSACLDHLATLRQSCCEVGRPLAPDFDRGRRARRGDPGLFGDSVRLACARTKCV